MLTVNLHLCNGDVMTLTLTRSQLNRLNRTLNQTTLPVTPFEANVNGYDLMIPWRSIGYISAAPQAGSDFGSNQAAD